ncbi:hypothetical protein Poly30_15350 [Planctomycetes bacterium Poly30]|uniref:Uncharacterized protein n=1 Tax=Saltatorellus ferox TaxID=2528018 RepID=A0A518EPL5_9BACT|nr:hypothetical protein Poly30_15350 [Planctomycetes bacterium Poly30]
MNLVSKGVACAVLLCGIGAAKPVPQEGPDGAASQESQATGGSIPVKVVAGRLVVSCDLATAANRIPVNLFLEHEGRHGLQLHNRAAATLRAESADGTPRSIAMLFPGFRVDVPARELGPEEEFEEFTKYHSAEMGENALVGSIGVDVLKDWTVTFALASGAVRLEPPASDETVASTPGGIVSSVFVESDGTVVAPLSLIDDMAWLPVRWNSGEPAGFMLGTSKYDTRIDVRAARRVGKPAGDVGTVRIGEIDLSKYVAFRPEAVVEVHPDLALGITGIGLLESFEVRVDRARREVRMKPIRAAKYPEADFAFFSARAKESPDALLGYLESYPGARLAPEAARLLLDDSLADMASPEDVNAAVKWIYDTMEGDLRTTRMLDLMKEMADAGESDVVVAAGALGIEAGRDDRYPNAVHEVHGLLGRTLLDRGDGDEAWRHLLSAAFGLPEDGRVNYDLGRFYESQGRFRRAFSRYVQAVISPESGGLAIDAMQRVQPLLATSDDDTREPYSVAMVERMIAGKVRSFGAASPFVKSEETPVLRTVLVEFFTNGHFGNEERGGAIGGALGMEGLIGHFSPDSGVERGIEFESGDAEVSGVVGTEAEAEKPEEANVVFLEYHLPVPRPDALCTSLGAKRAAQLRVGDPEVIVVDGAVRSAGAGKWRDAEEIYNRGRRAVLGRLATLGDHELDLLDASYEDGVLSGTVEVYGPRGEDLAVEVVLAEGRVLYPGTSGVVVHRRVARGSLLGGTEPLGFSEDDGEDEVTFEFRRPVSEIEDAMAAHLDQLESEGAGSAPRISMTIDPREMRIIAFLYDRRTGAVLSADEIIPEGIPGDELRVLDVEAAPASAGGR